MFEELLACKVGLPDAFCGKLANHLSLGRDSGVVGAGHPQSILALHARTAHENILNGIVEHVAHVQHAGHVWRRYYNSIGLACIGFAVEKLVLKPISIPPVFYFGRIVFLWEVFHFLIHLTAQN